MTRAKLCLVWMCGIIMSAHGVLADNDATCGRGYYRRADGECILCNSSVGPYYCTGDDTLTPCPADPWDVAQYERYTGHKLVSNGSISVWSNELDRLVCAPEHCHHYVEFEVNGSRYVMQGLWNGTNYWNDTHYWSKVADGWYLSDVSFTAGDGGALYLSVKPCTNAPENAHYTGPGTPDDPVRSGGRTDYNDCPWECDAGYALRNGVCVALCGAGFTQLKSSTGVSVNVYAARPSTPALNISTSRGTCFVKLESGSANGAINVNYNGNTYHTVD